MMRFGRNRKTLGYSLAEMAIVLGVIGLVLGTVWKTAGTVQENVRRETAYNQVIMIVDNIRTYYRGRAGIVDPAAGTLTNFLIEQKVLPTEMIRDRTEASLKVDLPWGRDGVNGASLVNGGLVVVAGGQSFILELHGLNDAACVYLARQLATSPDASGLDSVEVNGSAVYDVLGGTELDSIKDINDECAKAGAIGTTIELSYRLRSSF